MCSVTSDSSNPWTVARQTPQPMGLCRQEYWSGLPFPSPGDLRNPGIEPASPACISCTGRWVLYHWAVGEALIFLIYNCHQVNIANEDVEFPDIKTKIFFFFARNSPLPILIILSLLVTSAFTAGLLSPIGVLLGVLPVTFHHVNRLDLPNKWQQVW